jgi:hypothetical protein
MTPGINALIDWDKVCEDLGSKSVQSTKERFRQISEYPASITYSTIRYRPEIVDRFSVQ